MFISKRWITGLLALTMAAGACLGEEPAEPTKFYKMEFVVKEVAANKVLNSRTYSTMVSTEKNTRGEIRAGSKIPYAAGPGNIQQVDVGARVDLHAIREVQDRLAFGIIVEVSSVADSGANNMTPTIRQNTWSSTLSVPLRKPTLLFSSENLDAKTQMQIEVTATPVP